jgi:hypothetical protein
MDQIKKEKEMQLKKQAVALENYDFDDEECDDDYEQEERYSIDSNSLIPL